MQQQQAAATAQQATQLPTIVMDDDFEDFAQGAPLPFVSPASFLVLCRR
jgi:hypothetical protein